MNIEIIKTLLQPYNNAKLSVELVPTSLWNINIRYIKSTILWNKIRRDTYKKANYKCEICSGKGDKWPVECHEMWGYDDDSHTQTLKGFIALCPSCHQVKHIGLAEIKGNGVIAKNHLNEINGWTTKVSDTYLILVWKLWEERNKYRWKNNIDYLETWEN